MFDLRLIVNSLVFSTIGIVMLWVGFFMFDKITPYNLWKEVCEKNNIAIAIIVGSFSIGISLIIASAIH